MPDIFDTLAPESEDQSSVTYQDVAHRDFEEPKPSGDIFDQIAPEGGGQTGDIFDQISPEPASQTPQTDSALMEGAKRFGKAAWETAKEFVPKSLAEAEHMAFSLTPQAQIYQQNRNLYDYLTGKKGAVEAATTGLPVAQRIPEIQAAEQTPAWSYERMKAGMGTLADLAMLAGIGKGIAKGPRAAAEARGPTAVEAEVGRPPTGYVGPGTAAEDVGRAMERRFTMPEPPPEAAPELATAPTVEEGLAATEPRISPETGGEYFPEAGVGAPPEVPPVAETARVGGEQYAIEPSTTQMEARPAPLGVEEGAGSEVTGTGRSYNVEREAQGAEAGGAVPQEAVEPAAAGAQGLPDGWVDEGLHTEYPEIGAKMDRYIMENDPKGMFQALKDPRYPEYQQQLQLMLRKTYGDEIPVARISGYGTGGTGKSGGLAYVSVSTNPEWGAAAAKQGYPIWRGTVKPEDVVLAGHEAEGELIVKKSGIQTDVSRQDVNVAAPSRQAVEPPAAGAQPPPVQTGISQARTEAELGAGSVEPGAGAEMGSGIAFGREYINKGGDPRLPIRRANTSGLVGKNEVGIVHAELERLRGERNAAAQLLEANPDNPTVRAAFDAADAAQRAWRKELQPVLTKASDTLREAHAQSMPDADPGTYQGLADIMDEHFKGQVERTPEMRTRMAKAAKGVRQTEDIANGKMNDVEKTLTDQVTKKGKKVMSPEELDADLKKELENQFKDCILNG